MILPPQSHTDNKFYYLFKRANKIMFVFGIFIIVWELHGEVIYKMRRKSQRSLIFCRLAGSPDQGVIYSRLKHLVLSEENGYE